MEKVTVNTKLEIRYIIVTTCDGGLNINASIYENIESAIEFIKRVNYDAECVGKNEQGQEMYWYDAVKNVHLRIVEMLEKVRVQ